MINIFHAELNYHSIVIIIIIVANEYNNSGGCEPVILLRFGYNVNTLHSV